MAPCAATALLPRLRQIRQASEALIAGLEPEDLCLQGMADASPAKWHLGHTTWFFETFVLERAIEGYERFHDRYRYLFNSYYYSAGQMHARPRRGLLSRPTLAEILDYRAHVDAAMEKLIEKSGDDPDIAFRVVLGINHEQQHQELFLTDIKHVLSCNPLQPAYDDNLRRPEPGAAPAMKFNAGPAGIHQVGATGDGFCFDNETPRHDTLLHPHSLGNRLVTNGEFREFIDAGGYENSDLWLSDGWAAINERGWNRPLYWDEGLDSEFTLAGVRDIDPAAPVAHSYTASSSAAWGRSTSSTAPSRSQKPCANASANASSRQDGTSCPNCSLVRGCSPMPRRSACTTSRRSRSISPTWQTMPSSPTSSTCP